MLTRKPMTLRLRALKPKGNRADVESVKRILMVEDDPIVAIVYERFLKAHGFETEVARDGSAGLQCLLNYRPDAVLLDLMMPKINGFGVLASIRSDPSLSDVPVVVMTAAAIPSLVKMAKDGGAQRVFDKSNDKPLAVVNYLHDLLGTTSDSSLVGSDERVEFPIPCWSVGRSGCAALRELRNTTKITPLRHSTSGAPFANGVLFKGWPGGIGAVWEEGPKKPLRELLHEAAPKPKRSDREERRAAVENDR